MSTPTTHDDRCEQGPRGKYNGMTIGTSGDPVPCHCPARAQGREEAQFDLAQQAGQVSAASRAAEFGAASEEPEPQLVRLNFQGNLAYDADSVPGPTLSLGELLGDLQDAIENVLCCSNLRLFVTLTRNTTLLGVTHIKLLLNTRIEIDRILRQPQLSK